ncbi:aminodeoxychorismate synthase component I [Oceanobacillus salinisoli]|uniref:aminodeoxychorismate synthase component I n=1 Tax=Oceanobacillus salinisoli TaxID=2678611 RepID=UPI0012E1D593|nr:aminodeoxychorismate synthase component I [Oceanobacillus salinisoli]
MQSKHLTKNPRLSFEFASSTGEVHPLTFENPIEVIEASTVEEVLSGLHRIQDAIQDGYYAAGFLSYESAPAFHPACKVKEGHHMPLIWFGIFSEPEHRALSTSGNFELTEWTPSVQVDEYNRAIQTIKNEIEDGNTYQVNFTTRLYSKFQGDDIAFFEKLKRAQVSNYSAYIDTGEYRILSASPELFFHVEGENITTRPMKGTIKRGHAFAEDEANAKWLYHSEKNRAENVMIVDLLRNDLGMIAEPGTVHVPKLFKIEQYPTVHQMTSTITAKLKENTELIDIFKALFPCGSITGAPKISTMEIISDLEATPREVYCGAIGYITPMNEAIFNVPIRTVVIDEKSGMATYGVGGGITWDSTAEGEYDELLAKASLLKEDRPEFHVLESLLLDNGEIFLLEEHLNRLTNTAKYFGFPFNLASAHESLQDLARKNQDGEYKVRLLLFKNGLITIEAQPITQPETPLKVSLAEEPLDKNNPFLYHKTTHRAVYSPFQKNEVYDVLLRNEDGELTEFTNGNVVLEIDGKLCTPPIQSGLLAGTFRERLINNGEIFEKRLMVEDLKRCTKIWFINSVRKWLQVEMV